MALGKIKRCASKRMALAACFRCKTSEMSREGGEKQIRLGCEGAWISSVNANWLSCTPPQGGRGEDTSLFLLAAENTTGQTRQARLTVKRLAGSEVQTVLVTQYAK